MRRPVSLLALASAGVAVLLALGEGELATPPLDAFGPWLEQRGAVTAGFALVRVGALVAGYYLIAVSLLHCLATLFRSRSLASIATLVTAPALSSIIVVSSVAPAFADTPPPPSSSDRLVELPLEEPAAPSDTATLHLLTPPPPPTPAPPVATPPTTGVDTWTVAPGDSFWSIASDALHGARGREPADADVLPYWQSLIAANRDILVVPDNADLLFPGQVVTLLPVSPA